MDGKEQSNGFWAFDSSWGFIVNDYGLPLVQLLISLLYSIYRSLTVMNASILLLCYIPTGFYMFRLVKNVYVTSQERLKRKKMEIDEIQLQIQVVSTKLCVREAEFAERAELVRQSAARLRGLRARVSGVIDASDALRLALGHLPSDPDTELKMQDSSTDEERDFVMSFIKELKADPDAKPDADSEKMDGSDNYHLGPTSSEQSIYSSLNDMDAKDYRVKVVKVTNVYRVSYLRHYIKQKRMRRATRQAVLKKKIEAIKKLLEEWQRSLAMVINTKNSILSTSLDMTSQDAMGDYSKPNLRDSSDSDSDLRHSTSDVYFDEYSSSWSQNPYKNYPYNYEENMEQPPFEPAEFEQPAPAQSYCECAVKSRNILFILPEETSSQLAIEELKKDLETDCRDVVAA